MAPTYVIHLAAYYDFTGLEHPEYMRTNVTGLRNVLDLSAGLSLRRFIFASSLAACEFPPDGRALTESSLPTASTSTPAPSASAKSWSTNTSARFPR